MTTGNHKKNSPFIKTRAQTRIQTKSGLSELAKSPLLHINDNEKTKNVSKTVLKKAVTKDLQNDVSLLYCKTNVDKLSPNEINPASGLNKLEEKYDFVLQENKVLKQHVDKIEKTLEIMGQTWLWDETISTYFEILTLNIIGNDGDIYLMNPVLVEAVKVLEDITVILDPLHLREKNILLIPINNAKYDSTNKDSYKTVEGSHWSLLAYERQSHNYYYYDSLKNSSSASIAKLVCNRLSKYFDKTEEPSLFTIRGPMQNNSYDCGILMLHAVECILKNYRNANFFRP